MKPQGTISITVRETHHRDVKENLHYGQFALIYRAFTFTLGAMLKDNQLPAIYAWLVGEAPLTLPPMDQKVTLDKGN